MRYQAVSHTFIYPYWGSSCLLKSSMRFVKKATPHIRGKYQADLLHNRTIMLVITSNALSKLVGNHNDKVLSEKERSLSATFCLHLYPL